MRSPRLLGWSSGRIILSLYLLSSLLGAAGAIAFGDLLTTSETPGHAMRAADPLRAFGSVIGKALAPLAEGDGLIPILVALR